jgi:hypothetical protein
MHQPATGRRAGAATDARIPERPPLELGAGSARTHHVAAGEDHGIGAAAFSPQGARHGLVQVGHALLDAALLDERGADLTQRTQLEIEIAGQAGSLESFARPRFAADGIRAVVRRSEQEPSAEGLDSEPIYEARGTGEPAPGCCSVSKVRPVTPGSPRRCWCRPGRRRICMPAGGSSSPPSGAVPRVLVWDGEGAVGRWRGKRINGGSATAGT